ncbi:universal stress protein [Corynebacterium yudongzhengii]|uniref:Universal stress protein n=1 Tax=Corynebacterium yudongzhengii TaxID=2080740 RepID=A0A2U1T4D6_9CORY|nr:universal stress protein [Corynebacterium yudongzhengii]AWB82837.1 universal stress protein [Corynebacterium yudongzhengii]PWC00876.1 universal stress protein [Corynebacterium yudongzhengii]
MAKDSSTSGDDIIAEPRTRAAHTPLRLLVAWQPGPGGDEAISTAAWLARTLLVRVRAVSMILRLWPATSISKLGSGYDDWLADETKTYSRKVRKAFAEAGIDKAQWDNEVAVVTDGPSESALLTEAAEDFDADLLIVGSHTAAPKGRFLTGTTSDALLHSSTTPLMLAPRAVKLSKRGITRVNVAYLAPFDDADYSHQESQSNQALYFGGELAARLGVNLRLTAFSPTGLSENFPDDRIDFTRQLSDEWGEQALSVLDRARDMIVDHLPDLKVDTALGSGAGWSGAIDALKWKKGDLLTFGSTQSGPIERVFVGSTAAQFMQHVPVPVVVHPSPADSWY